VRIGGPDCSRPYEMALLNSGNPRASLALASGS